MNSSNQNQTPPFSLKFAVRCGDYIIIGGESLTDISISATDAATGEVFASSVYTSENIPGNRQFLMIARDNQSRVPVKIEFKTTGNAQSLLLDPNKLPRTLRGIEKVVTPAIRLDLYKHFMPFSDEWNLFLKYVSPEYFNDINIDKLEQDEQALINNIHELLPRIKPTNLMCFIDSYIGINVSGWVKSPDSEKPQLISVFQDDVPLKEGFIANEFREDIKKAGFGTGKYSFNLRALPTREGFTCFTIRNPENEIIYFRYYDASPYRLPEKYKISIETYIPEIRGWCIGEGRPDYIFNLDLFIDDTFWTTVPNSDPRVDLLAHGLSDGFGGFHAISPFSFMDSGKHVLRARFPDGAFSRAFAFRGDHLPEPVRDLSILDKKVSIIIPVYNAPDDLRDCLLSISRHTPKNTRVILVDDCSPDPEVGRLLESLDNSGNYVILRNEKNLGFSGSINRGIKAAGDDDVILLNSDTRVTPKWLQSILLASSIYPRVATVTPMSDRAGAFSAPEIGNENTLPPGATEEEFAIAFRRASLGVYPDVPTGNGFCMFVSRECINEVGLFDQEAFPRGYGEENDFCMRALRAGWRNIIDDRTYIYHESGKSFKEAKTDLVKRGLSILAERYPEYRKSLWVFGSGSPLATARFAARRAYNNWRRLNKPRILYVISTTEGGTPQTNQDLMGQMEEFAECYLLQSDSHSMQLSIFRNGEVHPLYTHILTERVDPFTHESAEYDAVLASWLIKLDIDLVHIRHLLWQSLNLATIASGLGCKVVYSMHDYYTLGPNHNLLDDTGTFEGDDFYGPDSIYRANLWEDKTDGAVRLPEGEPGFLKHWKGRFLEKIAECDAFVTTSPSARQTIFNGLPSLDPAKFHVIPHGRDFQEFYNLRATRRPDEKIRIIVLGNINYQKGLGLLQSLKEYDESHYNILEVHILGNCKNAENLPFITYGAYKREDVARLIGEIRPHAAAVLSIWNETWCHTLTELWACGVPVFALDSGTVAERIRESGCGWILNQDDIGVCYSEILQKIQDKDATHKAELALASWQTGPGYTGTVEKMGSEYRQLYRKLLEKKSTEKKFTVGVCGSPATASSHVRLFNFTRNFAGREIDYRHLSPGQLMESARNNELDAVILQRTFMPGFLVDEAIALFKEKSIPYAYELDDNLLNMESHGEKKAYNHNIQWVDKLARNSSLVIVSTPELAEELAPINNAIEVFETRLDAPLWEPEPSPKAYNGKIGVLYYGTTTHLDDLRLVLPAFQEIYREKPNLELILIGVAPEGAGELAKYEFIRAVPVSRENGPYPQFVSFLRNQARVADFGIAPLVDNAFNRSKSALKIYEYASLGLPCIASNTGPYKKLAHFPYLTLCENTTESWYAAIRARIGDKKPEKVVKDELRDYVKKNHFMEKGDLNRYDQLIKRIHASYAR